MNPALKAVDEVMAHCTPSQMSASAAIDFLSEVISELEVRREALEQEVGEE